MNLTHARNHVHSRLMASALAGIGVLVATLSGVQRAAAFEWQTSTPEAQDVSSAALDKLVDDLAAKNSKALLVVRNDHIICEWYAPGHSSTTPHYSASMAKALVGGVALSVAIDDGRIARDDLASKYIPKWRDDRRKSQITIRQLGSHTSGLADASEGAVPHENLTGWKGDFWKRLDPPHDPFTISRDLTPLSFEPGAIWQYSNPGIAMLSYAVTAALHDAPQRDVRSLLRERVMRPLGIADKEWSCGYGKTFEVDGLSLVAAWGGGSFSARASARIGRLMLKRGKWDGRQIVGAEAVRQVTSSSGLPGAGGMGWWTNADGKVPALPPDAFWAAGAGGQVTLVVPSLQLIAVRNGNRFDGRDNDTALARHVFAPLMAAIEQNSDGNSAKTAAIPRSKLKLSWAPVASVIRKARGSDNWPMTWGDDDALYTAYGDGQGFEPFVAKKLSLGLAKITGTSTDFTGLNLRSATAEATGDDSSGHKASGMLMVDGVLYMLARNVGNSRLAWSEDHGKSWTWVDWRFTESLGAPSFVNFGRNYAGARDEFIYVASHDADSAYETADACVLARTPKNRLRDQSAWEYFAGIVDGKSKWSSRVSERRPILENPGKCYRTSMTYNAPLHRYLLVHTVPISAAVSTKSAGKPDLRTTGGLAIYDAPEPWGPWTTVFSTDQWDIGPGESASFPTKWISPDGKSLALVFSGDDCFSVRAAKIETSSQSDEK